MYSSGLCPQFASLHHCVRGFIQGVPQWLSMGGTVCRCPVVHCQVLGGTAGEGGDMEVRDGEETPASEHRKDKDSDVWHESGSAV